MYAFLVVITELSEFLSLFLFLTLVGREFCQQVTPMVFGKPFGILLNQLWVWKIKKNTWLGDVGCQICDVEVVVLLPLCYGCVMSLGKMFIHMPVTKQ